MNMDLALFLLAFTMLWKCKCGLCVVFLIIKITLSSPTALCYLELSVKGVKDQT